MQQLATHTKGNVSKRDNPMLRKRLVSFIQKTMASMIIVRKSLKVKDDDFSVLVVLMNSYINRNSGMTRYEIYIGCGFTTNCGYTLMRERLYNLVNRGLIEIIGK